MGQREYTQSIKHPLCSWQHNQLYVKKVLTSGFLCQTIESSSRGGNQGEEVALSQLVPCVTFAKSCFWNLPVGYLML